METILEYALHRLPETGVGLVGHVIGGIVVSIIGVSILEYLVHRYLMHQRILPLVFHRNIIFLQEMLSKHLRHHYLWYQTFDYEPDGAGRKESMRLEWTDTVLAEIAFLPLTLCVALASPIAACVFFSAIIVHNQVWNAIHSQMHQRYQECKWRHWSLFKVLARHHFMHHQKPSKNFNTVLPFFDYALCLFGKDSIATPNEDDVREMTRLGIFR